MPLKNLHTMPTNLSKHFKDIKEAEQERRVEYAITKLEEMGFDVLRKTKAKIQFQFKGRTVRVFPYSGWFSGKTVQDGRGIKNLLKQLKPSHNAND